MPIGYANFSTIEQANNQTVNQLAGLGKQIGNAIETHAATQSAQAMLPMLQQQYQTGMAKIANGDPNGLGDIYSASIVASQNPLLAPMAKNAITTAQSANINAQHMLRTQAYLGGRMASLYGQYGSGLMQPPEGMNPNWQGKQTAAKALTPVQQISALNNFNKLDKDLAEKQADARRLGDTDTYNQILQQRSDLRNSLSQSQINTMPISGIDTLPIDTSQQVSDLQKQIKEEKAKGKGGLLRRGTDPQKIQDWQNKIQKLQQSGGSQLPSARGAGGGNVDANIGNTIIKLPTGKSIKASDYMKAIQDLKADPSTKGIFDSHFGKGSADQILKGSQTSADTGGENQVAQASPESQDESEAVGGGSEQTEVA